MSITNLGNFSFLTFFNLIIILLLFLLNIYLYLSEPAKKEVVESGIISTKIKNYLTHIVTITGLYASYLTIKSDKYNTKEKVELLEDFNKKLSSLKEENIKLLEEAQKENIQKLNIEELAVMLNNRDNKIIDCTNELRKFRDNPDKFKITDSNLKYELQTRNTELENWLKDHPDYEGAMRAFSQENSIVEPSSSQIESDEINKSFILGSFLENFDDLDAISKLCVSLLLSNSILFSSLSSIFFVIYGDYLIKKYDLEVKYPKLAKIIKLRRKFQKYYLIVDSLVIISLILAQVIFCIAVLLL